MAQAYFGGVAGPSVLRGAGKPAAAQPAYGEAIARYDQVAKDPARADRKNDDAPLAIAISLPAVSSLTQLPWLDLSSLVAWFFGVPRGVAGRMGLHIHPDRLSALLREDLAPAGPGTRWHHRRKLPRKTA